MFDFLRRKKPPSERDGVFEDLRGASEELKTADHLVRIEVGMAINFATTAFVSTFKDPSAFQSIPREQQLQYMSKLKAAEVQARTRHDHSAALGFGLFNIWLGALITKDDELMAEIKPQLSALSQEADAIQSAL